jgi:hypothetical protein
MRRLPLILGLALIAALTVREVYDFLVTNEGLRYFSSEPRRILYVLLLGIAGGSVAFGLSRLSPRSQRTLKLTLLGTTGAFLIGVVGLFAYHLTWAAPMLTEAGMWGWICAAFASLVLIDGLVLFEFRQAWRQK